MNLYYKEERILGENDLKEIDEKLDSKIVVNKNLIINWYLANPVNRKNATEYINDGITIDGWYSSNGTVTLTNDGITNKKKPGNTAEDWSQFYQKIEEKYIPAGSMVTISCLIDGNLYTASRVANRNSSFNFSVYVSENDRLRVNWAQNLFWTTFIITSDKTYNLQAIKLELGSVQTLAHKENGQWVLNEIPKYAEQYSICEQYDLSNGNFIGNQRSNPNILINHYFVGGGSQQGGGKFPINRQGKTEYTEAGYTFDGWHSSGCKVEIQSDCIAVSNESQNFHLKQIINQELAEDTKFTFSILVVSGNGTMYLRRSTWDTYATCAITGPGLYAITGTIPKDSKPMVQFQPAIGNSIKAKAAKLELGSVQTLAHKEGDAWVLNEIPNYGEQYAICEQYSLITGEFIGSQHSNQNLLDVWYFPKPVNQQGEKIYSNNTGTSAYCIDRWKLRFASAALEDDGILLSNLEAANVNTLRYCFWQYIDPNVLMAGRTYTYSLLTKTPTSEKLGADIVGMMVNGVNYDFTSYRDGNLNCLRFVCPNDVSAVTLNINLYGGESIKIIAAKLELGSVQTLAHKEGNTWVLNDPPPNYQQELAKCQRHYIKSWVGGPITADNRPTDRVVKCAMAVNRLEPVRFPVTMRAVPKITIFALQNGETGTAAKWTNDAQVPVVAGYIGPNGFIVTSASNDFEKGEYYSFQYIADANL